MNILITGGLGYVGGRLTEYFSKLPSHQVYTLSRNKKFNEPIENIKVLRNFEVLVKNKLKEIQIDVIIHLASINEHECVNKPMEAVDVNIKGTLEWLLWAREKKVKKFLYFSTAHVYNKPLAGNLDEEVAAFPRHPYAITHKCAEDYVLSFFYDYDLDTRIVRLSNSFGYPAFTTANRWTLLINDFCRTIVKDRSLTIHSNRLQKRDFISLTSVCDAVEKLISYEVPKGDNRLFNLCSSESRTLFDIGSWIKTIAEDYFQERIVFSYDPAKDHPVDPLHLSNQKLQRTGWLPTYQKDVWEIQKTLDFFLKYNS